MDNLEWFVKFMKIHMKRHNLHPWPMPSDGEYQVQMDVWHSALVRSGFSSDIADRASDLLADEDIPWAKHRPRFLQIGHDLCRSRNQSVMGNGSESRDANQAASKDCPNCSGQGLAGRNRHQPIADGIGHNAAGLWITFTCICPMGRWIALSRNSNPACTKLPELARYPELLVRPTGDGSLGNPFLHKSGAWDYLNDCLKPLDRDWRLDKKTFAVLSVKEVLSRPRSAYVAPIIESPIL